MPIVGLGTDWDAASSKISKDPHELINKMVFTDGVFNWGNTMQKDDLKKQKVIWLVYKNTNLNLFAAKYNS